MTDRKYQEAGPSSRSVSIPTLMVSFFVIALVIFVGVYIIIGSDQRRQSLDVVNAASAISVGQQASWRAIGRYALGSRQLQDANPETIGFLENSKIEYELVDAEADQLLFTVEASKDGESGSDAFVRVLLRDGRVASVLCSDTGEACRSEELFNPDIDAR